MIIIGIDCGQTGGVAAIDGDGQLLMYCRMPIIQHGKRKLVDTAKLDHFFKPDHADQLLFCIEQVSAMPSQGSVSGFNFGRAAGAVEGWALSYGVPVQFVTPQKWKKDLNLSSDKQQSLDRAKLEFGQLKIWDVKANDGIAEAALIALWHLKQLRKTS